MPAHSEAGTIATLIESISTPEIWMVKAILDRSGAVSAARSRSIGHLNLSQPLGSSAA
jgi:hypothetical protein